MAGLPADDPLVVAQMRRFIHACEEMHTAASLLGIGPPSHATFPDRADAWLYRVQRNRADWQMIFISPLFDQKVAT